MTKSVSLLNIDRQKYLNLLKSEGYSGAITTLHRDLERWENETFEGAQGYQPKLWDQVEEVRAFSRELWEMALQNPKGA